MKYITTNIEGIGDIIWSYEFNSFHFQYKTILLQQIIPEGSIVIDIGAHDGFFSLIFGSCVGKNGKVLAFEPNPTTFSHLKKYTELNSLNIIPYNLAITPENKKYIFNYTDSNQWGTATNGGFFDTLKSGNDLKFVHSQQIEVKGVNFIDFINQNYKNEIDKIQFIKIDTEGNDKEIIKTLKPITDISKPCILTEAFQSLSLEEIEDFYYSIKNIDYEIFDVSPLDDIRTCCGPLTLEEFIYYIYKINGNGNMLCIHKDRLNEFNLDYNNSNEYCVILIEDEKNDLFRLSKYIDVFDEIIYIGNKEKEYLCSLYPNLKYIEINEIENYSNKINIGIKNTKSEFICLGDLKQDPPKKIDLNINRYTLGSINNLLIGAKNIFNKIQGAEEQILDNENIKYNMVKKASIMGYNINVSNPITPLSKEWVIEYDKLVPNGFHFYETFISRNNL